MTERVSGFCTCKANPFKGVLVDPDCPRGHGRASSNRVCGALGIAAGDRCQKPAGHDGPHEGAISAHATRNREAKP